MLPISLQPMCSITTSGVWSSIIGFTYVSIRFTVAPINSLNLVLHLLNFELNYFLRILLVKLVPRIYAFRPNFTSLLNSVLPGTTDVVAFFIWWCSRSLCGYLLTTGDGLRVFCIANCLFVGRSMVWASSSLTSVDSV